MRKSKWYKTETTAWLLLGEFQSDLLGDLATSGNKLSVYRVEDDCSNLERLVAALAANCDRIANFDYVLFEEKILKDIGIKSEHTKGETPDETVNNCHLDLIELSAFRLVDLAKQILDRGKVERFSPLKVTNLLADSIKKGYLNKAKMRLIPKEIEKIDKLIQSNSAFNSD
ncbi:MAG: hypothetical protein V7K88_10110 [Nostoc sp.]|uniref:hypothetical protein n=1 Tax=Nostoc sp. TaxID=1180 RepID=UPI002FFA1CB2